MIDKWDLKEGQDKFNFMETMVKSADIQKVLIILDKKYSEKADQRSGGVGTETQIISPKIYGDVSQEKFIPIVAEKDEDGSAYIPAFLESRIYIDFSEEENFEEKYETLLRNIHQRPAYSKPNLGKAPSYIFEQTPMKYKTSSIIRSFDNQIAKFPKRINSILKEFLDEFIDNMKDYSVDLTGVRDVNLVGKAIYDNINSYTPLRNDYIIFLDKLFKSDLEFDIDIFIRFFEKLPILEAPQDNRSSWTKNEFENFRFFIHEIFLYTIAMGLKTEKYKFLEEIFYSGYLFKDDYSYKIEPQRFDALYNYTEIFDKYYKETFSKNFISPMADLIMKRLPDKVNKDELINADLLCHYVSVLDKLRWFPITYIYINNYERKFELFNRLVSLRHFEKVKILFKVQTVEEFQNKLNEIKEADEFPNKIRYSNAFESVVPIYKLINIDKIGTIR